MDKDEAFSAPPPMAELGNYKGVMLCNRPTPADGLKPNAVVRPFRSAIPATVGDSLGLTRKKESMPSEVKRCGPSAALRRHCRWLKELQKQVAQDAERSEQEERGQKEKQQQMKEAFQKQREAIRLIKLSDARADELTSILNPNCKAKQKPLWAMTEHEREDREEEDAGELITFAEALDYDEYIHDLEFRECVQAITDRAKNLQRQQQAFKDALLRDFEEASTAPSEKASERPERPRAELDERPAWDAAPTEASEAAELMERAWQDGQLKGVHSKNSLKKLAERELREVESSA